jgi:glycosyltransferase involved in cell wall biosynthesis
MKKKRIKNLIFFCIIIIIINFILKFLNYKINIKIKIEFIISYFQIKKEFKRNKIYFNYINNKLIIIKAFKLIKKPKVSVISPIYNREKYISKFLKIIQSQSFNFIEIIFIDDCSIDNSVNLIEEYKKKDERIILIKNNLNKGTFISRNIGALYSNSKYVILPDPDDILDKNIISLCFKYSEKYNFDMIRFNIFKINGNKAYNVYNQEKEKISIKQPELSRYMFYGNNELYIIDYYIHNKFIQKELFIKALNSINKFHLNLYITLWEDTIISYILYRNSKSFCSLQKIGYFYIKNSQSITKNMFKISELKMKFIFIFLKIVFEYSKNSKYEKDMFNLLFTQMNNKVNLANSIKNLSVNSNYYFYYEMIKMFLNSSFISEENKNELNNFIFIIEKKLKK